MTSGANTTSIATASAPWKTAAACFSMLAMSDPAARASDGGAVRDPRKWRKSACESCGSTYELEAHHRDEDRVNNTPENIRTLCRTCHRAEHVELRRARGKKRYDGVDRIQIQVARAGLGWSAEELAKRSQLSLAWRPVRRVESEDGIAPNKIYAIQHTFEEAGIVFLEED
jgi:hypothetical protein